MRFRIYILLILAPFILLSCAGDGKEIAQWNERSVTRGEFRSWLQARGEDPEEILKSDEAVNDMLRAMALEDLTMKEAKENGFLDSAEAKMVGDLTARNYTAEYVRDKLTSEQKYSERAVKLYLIQMYVKDYAISNGERVPLSPHELKKAREKRVEEARSIIAKIHGGQSFEEMAKRYSDDYSRRNGGYVGYLTADMKSVPFIEDILSMKKGDILEEPKAEGNHVYIFHARDVVELTPSNIDELIDDERERSRLRQELEGRATEALRSTLVPDLELTIHREITGNEGPDYRVISYSGGGMTLKELRREVEFIRDATTLFGASRIPSDTQSHLRQHLVIVADQVLWNAAGETQGLLESQDYKDRLDALVREALSKVYMARTLSLDIDISDDELKKAYEEYRAAARNAASYNDIAERLRQSIIATKMDEKRKAYENRLLREAGFALR